MKMYTPSQWILFFYIYCFLGWVWESVYVSIRERRLVNRGFLKGPFLPIYGTGALCVLFATLPFRGNYILMCLAGMVSAGILEYVTGAAMERLFCVRYWDYLERFLNLNGHICLSSILCWGVMTILVTDVFQVYLERLVLAVPVFYVRRIVMVLTPCLAADFATSFSTALHLRDLLLQKERLFAEMQKLSDKKKELETAIRSVGDKATEQLLNEVQELMAKISMEKDRVKLSYQKSIRDLLLRNPRAVSRWHREAFAELKQSVLEKIDSIKKT